jgi:hypothetical protein
MHAIEKLQLQSRSLNGESNAIRCDSENTVCASERSKFFSSFLSGLESLRVVTIIFGSDSSPTVGEMIEVSETPTNIGAKDPERFGVAFRSSSHLSV